MEPVSVFDILLLFTLPPKDSIHCSTKDAYTSEITFLALVLWFPVASSIMCCFWRVQNQSFSVLTFFSILCVATIFVYQQNKKHLHNFGTRKCFPPSRSCVDCIWTEEPLQLIIPLILSLLLQGWTWLMGNQDLQS